MNPDLENELPRYNRFEFLKKPAKVIGAMAVNGACGYLLAKGIDTLILDIDNTKVFETAIVGTSALVGGFIESELV